jgi:hypothetical protein
MGLRPNEPGRSYPLSGSAETPESGKEPGQQERSGQAGEDGEAPAFLEHVRSKHDNSPEGCPHFEAHIWDGHG